MPQAELDRGARLLSAIMAEVPPAARYLADAVRLRTRGRFHDEVVALARHISDAPNALYASHIRNEGDEVMDALEEAFAIGRGAGLPVVISHHKCAGPRNHGARTKLASC